VSLQDCIKKLALGPVDAAEFMQIVLDNNGNEEAAIEAFLVTMNQEEAQLRDMLVGQGVDAHPTVDPASQSLDANGMPLEQQVDITLHPNFEMWATGTTVVDLNGAPLRVYHATDRDFEGNAFNTRDTFEAGSHFGNAPQANQVAEGIGQANQVAEGIGQGHAAERLTPRVLPGYLNIRNPIRLIDMGSFDDTMVFPQLVEQGIIGAGEAEELMDSGDGNEAQRVMEEAGYDGVVYLNRHEGLDKKPTKFAHKFDEDGGFHTDANFRDGNPGAADSWIIFRPQQFKSAFNNGDFDPVTADFLRQDALAKTTQAIGSADTSIPQVAVALRALREHLGKKGKGHVNLDLGGGRYDLGIEFMREKNIANMVYDPFNRDIMHNFDIVERVRGTPPDSVTIPNVLNVVAEKAIQSDIMRQAAKAVKKDGTVYIQIYVGDSKRVGRVTKEKKGEPSTWQNNAPLKDYLGVVSEWFDDVSIVKMPYVTKEGKNSTVDMIVANGPKEVQGETMWGNGAPSEPFMIPSLWTKTSDLRRGTTNIRMGKHIDQKYHVHKDYFTEKYFPKDIVAKFKRDRKKVPFEFNAVQWNPKTGRLRFDEAPDFDTADEPTVGRMWDSESNEITSSDFIWHHKWMWVGDNYQGFGDAIGLSESKSRSKQWHHMLPKGQRSKTGTKDLWEPTKLKLDAQRADIEGYRNQFTDGGVSFFQDEIPKVEEATEISAVAGQRALDLIANRDPRMDEGTVGSILPHLRYYSETRREGKALVGAGTLNANAAAQLLGLDEARSRHPNPTASLDEWAAFLADAFARNDVPMPPYRFINDINGDAQPAIDNLSKLTAGQIADANHGFRNAAKFRKAYTDGNLTIATTARLFLWSFLSRGVSPYTQEGLFIDAFEGIEGFIDAAANGTLNVTPGDIDETSVNVDMGNGEERERLKQHMLGLEAAAAKDALKKQAKDLAAMGLEGVAVDDLVTEDTPLDVDSPPVGDNAPGFEWRVNDDGTVNLTWSQWVRLVAPKGSGQPGAGAAHNLNAFGKNFLIRMAESMGNGDERSRLQYIHELMEDPASTGRLIRREFAKVGQGVGIDNKVVSFSLLVAGFDDIMVLDRVQFRQLWNDGRFEGINLYDGYKQNKKVVTGSGFAKQGDGVRGIMIYEAIEDAVAAKVDYIYDALGRTGEGSVGRYHWESWVADSEQEASHGTLDAILSHAEGDGMAIHRVSAKQGEYGSYQYGARYGRTGDGTGFYDWATPDGTDYTFTVPQFVEFQRLLKLTKSGVVGSDFKVTETGNEPWFNRAEVNTEALNDLANRISEGRSGVGAGTVSRDGQDEAIPPRYSAASFEQSGKGDQGARGAFTPSSLILDQNGRPTNLIRIFEKADRSTFLHESSHFWLEQVKQDAEEYGGTFNREWNTIKEWWVSREPEIRKEAIERALKAGERGAADDISEMSTAKMVAYIRTGNLLGFKGGTRYITVAMHEQWARGSEEYFMTGEAPSLKLADAFAVFAAWLRSIYKAMQVITGKHGLDVKFSPEVKEVMDRLLASDEEINEVLAQYKLMPLFDNPTQALMTPTQWENYMRASHRIASTAKAKQVSKHLKDVAREEEEWWGREREKLRDDIEEEVAQDPAQRMLYSMLSTTLADGSEIPIELRSDRIQRKALQAVMGAESLDTLPSLNNRKLDVAQTSKDKTVVPEVAAATFGFDSVEDMIEALTTMQPFAEVVEAKIEQKMNETYGSMTSDAAIEAVATVHETDNIGHMLAMELAVLKEIEQTALKPAFVKAYARKQILKIPVEKLKPRQYLTLERRHAAEANASMRKNDRAGAYRHKFQQMYNHYLAQEALRAEKQLARDLRYLKKFNNRKRKWANVDAEYIDRIRLQMEGYDLGPKITEKQILKAELAAFAQWIEQRELEDGAILALPPHLVARMEKTDYRELSWSDFRDLVDAIKTLEKQGRLKKKLKKKGEEVDRDAVVSRMVSVLTSKGIRRNAKKRAKHASEESSRGLVRSLTGYDAALLKIEMLLELIDGEPLGEWHQAIFEPFNEAEALKKDLSAKVSKRITDRMDAMPKKQKRAMGRKVDVGAIAKPGEEWTRGELIMFVMNTGNVGNLDKMIRGENTKGRGLTEENVHEAVQLLNAEEVALVQEVWDIAEDLWPEVEAIHRNEKGRAPDRVERRPVETAHGTISGGYFPLMYDATMSTQAAAVEGKSALQMMQSTEVQASVNSSMTKERNAGFAQPLNYNVSNLTKGIDRTIHYISHYDAVRQATQLLNHKVLSTAMIDYLGSEYTDAIRKWVGYVAADANLIHLNALQRTVGAVASVTTAAVLGASASTMVAQALGLTVAIDRLLADTSYGPISMAELVKDLTVGWGMMFSPAKRKEMYAASGLMRHRLGAADRDIKNTIEVLKKKKGMVARASQGGLMAIAGAQMYLVDIPVWYTAYNRALRADPSDAETAVKYANRVIRLSQSSGDNKDLAEVQRDRGFGRVFTMYYSFLSALYAIQRQIGSEVTVNPLTYPRFAARIFMVITLTTMANALRQGDWPEDTDDPEADSFATWLAKRHLEDMTAAVPGLGAGVKGVTSEFGYELSPITMFGEQVADSILTIGELVDKAMDDDKSFEENDITKAMAELILNLAGLRGLSAIQARKTWEAFFEDWTNEDADVGFFDFFFGYDEPEE
jgi:hypothetical protein